MRIQPILFSCFALLISASAFSQELLSIQLSQRCIYSGDTMDTELYRFDSSYQVSEWVQEILQSSGAERNFELIQTNVENVSAVLDGDKRYLLYSLDFIQKASRLSVYAALAHEIGHHANRHTFRPENRIVEESEANYFMGYFLSKKNFSKGALEGFLKNLPSTHGIPLVEILKTIFKGYDKASRALTLESLAFDNDPKLQDLLLPTFTFQKCYTQVEIPHDKFAGIKNLGKVDEKIRLVLDQRGYYNRSYFSVNNGFAMVTQMEQYNQNDASIRNDRTRWLEYPARDNFAGVMDYLSSIVMPNKGYFRLFVFVVTSSAFKSSDEKVAKSEAAAWLSQGANRLPKTIANITFTDEYTVSALVYEFEVPESNRKARQVCPAPYFDARTHLVKSGLGRGFGF